MNILLVPIGSHGDVHPFVGLGSALRDRGHRVTVLTNSHFGPLIGRAELDFVALGSEDDYQQAISDPKLWEPIEGFKRVVEWGILRQMRPVYELIAERYLPGETVVLAQATAFGARIAQEALGVPLVTVNLQPALLRSVVEPPALPGYALVRRLPRAGRRLFYWFGDRLIVDPLLTKGVDAFRAELGLPRVRRFLDRWWFSPQRVLGLFPDWFAPPQPDWPPQVELTGFPLFDERGLEPVPVEVNEFLDRGDPPIVFTPGTAMAYGHEFFKAAVGACQRLNRRGILLTRFADQVPTPLPEGVRHVSYVPFSQLLPRASALVHHGGIGTSAQALAAGIPQLIMPMAHDQPDNAARLTRLGVGRALRPQAFHAPAVADALSALLGSSDVASRCRSLASRVLEADPMGDACASIERLGL
ncbi:MAG: glycosyltransferase [Isosphaeraceae bacterium]